jgi:uncharacterized protein (DUF2236 family)
MEFTPGDVIWGVHRELALLLGAGRALLLQLAHPLIAAGVQEHSDFSRDPLGRLARTLEPMYALIFGTPAASASAAAQMRRAHAPVRGVLREATGAYPAGTVYDAADPLLPVVHATLIDTAPRRAAAQGGLSSAAAARYYDDSRASWRAGWDVPTRSCRHAGLRAYAAEQPRRRARSAPRPRSWRHQSSAARGARPRHRGCGVAHRRAGAGRAW